MPLDPPAPPPRRLTDAAIAEMIHPVTVPHAWQVWAAQELQLVRALRPQAAWLLQHGRCSAHTKRFLQDLLTLTSAGR